jgi:spermidine/putrescine transport system permease protein
MTPRSLQGIAGLYVAGILAFLYGPILVMMALGFNRSELYELPFQFDLVWFRGLLDNERLVRASFNSLGLALVNALLATAIGVPAAVALARRIFPGKTLLYLLLLPPITIPWLILGVAMLIFFTWAHIGRGLHAMLIGHMAVSMPYAILVLLARFQGMNPELEDAASSLGAFPLQVFTRVTLPLLLPGVLAAFLFAFIVSFDNFAISYFLAPPGVSTLPIEIYTAIRTGITPEVNAISAIIFLLSTFFVLIAGRQVRFI